VINLISSRVGQARWTEHLSVFRYMARAPAEPTDTTTVAATLGVAITLAAAATLVFTQRDVQIH
jgi:hypothetical protein